MSINLEADIENLRKEDSELLVGTEIMALNALCNAYKTLNEKG